MTWCFLCGACLRVKLKVSEGCDVLSATGLELCNRHRRIVTLDRGHLVGFVS